MPKGTRGVSGRKRGIDGHRRLTSEREQRLGRSEGTLVVPGRLSGNNDEPVFLPRLVEDGELPEVTSNSLRTFIDYVASGIDIPASLEDEVKKKHSGEEITEAAKEGISRWHLPGKER